MKDIKIKDIYESSLVDAVVKEYGYSVPFKIARSQLVVVEETESGEKINLIIICSHSDLFDYRRSHSIKQDLKDWLKIRNPEIKRTDVIIIGEWRDVFVKAGYILIKNFNEINDAWAFEELQ